MRKIIAGLAIAAGLVVPTTASAQAKVKAEYEQVDFDAPAGQCIIVDVKRQHGSVWQPVSKQGSECVSHREFHPRTPARNGKVYFKYRVTQVAMSGGEATVAPPSNHPDSCEAMNYAKDCVVYAAVYSCIDGVDNDGDGLVDMDDEDFPEAIQTWSQSGDLPDPLSACDRGVTPIVATPIATLGTGWIRVKTDHWPAERIYQYVKGRFNDRFFNYCISKGKNLHSASHGRFYCYEPGFTYRNTALRKP